MKNAKCYNCKHSSKQFKIGDLTHLHCLNENIYPEEKLMTGEISPWDTLKVFSDTCDKHESPEQNKN